MGGPGSGPRPGQGKGKKRKSSGKKKSSGVAKRVDKLIKGINSLAARGRSKGKKKGKVRNWDTPIIRY